MGRSSVNKFDYSKSGGQSELFGLIRDCYPENVVLRQDVNLRKMYRRLGYRWGDLEREYGRTLSGVIVDIFSENPLFAVEYHGRQHFEFVQYFHGDLKGFYEGKERDNQKFWICQRLGIPLVVFRYDEKMTLELVSERIKDAIANFEPLEEVVKCEQCKRYVLPHYIKINACTLCHTPKKNNPPKLTKPPKLIKPSKPKLTEAQKQEQKQIQKELREKIKQNPTYIKNKNDAKEKAKQYRKEAQEKLKNNPTHQQKQAELKEKQKQAQKKYREQLKQNQQKNKLD